MSNVNDLLNVGSGILNDVTRAVETGNFEGLGERTKERVTFAATQFMGPQAAEDPARKVSQTFSQAAGQVRSAVNSSQSSVRHASVNPAHAAKNAYQPYRYDRPENRQKSYFLSKDAKKTAGLPQIVGGGVGAVTGAIGSIASFGAAAGTMVANTALPFISAGLGYAAAGVGIIFAGLFFISLGILNSGIRLKNLVKHYYEYGAAIGNAEYYSIDKLAARVGTTSRELTKNLERMIRGNLLPGARLDRKKTTLMLTDRAYEQYQAAEESRIEREAAAQLRGEPVVTVDRNLDGDVKRIIEDGNAAIRQVRAINDEIPDTLVMSDKLYRLEEIMRRIFEQVQKDPASASELRRFMDYYLPTTTKLLSAYVELDRQPVQGENIAKTKKEIEDSLDVINDAFEQLLDGMFSDMALDISSDISVLKTMMKQDGLSSDGPMS